MNEIRQRRCRVLRSARRREAELEVAGLSRLEAGKMLERRTPSEELKLEPTGSTPSTGAMCTTASGNVVDAVRVKATCEPGFTLNRDWSLGVGGVQTTESVAPRRRDEQQQRTAVTASAAGTRERRMLEISLSLLIQRILRNELCGTARVGRPTLFGGASRLPSASCA